MSVGVLVHFSFVALYYAYSCKPNIVSREAVPERAHTSRPEEPKELGCHVAPPTLERVQCLDLSAAHNILYKA